MAHRLGELARLFLKLGTISFGGPAAHVAIMEDEVVQRRGWLTRQHFLDLIGATQLIPGPNAVEMASHVGYHRAGLPGSVVGGVCFTLPAVLIAIGCAWGYQRDGERPQVETFLYGIKAAVLAVIFVAVFRLGKKAFGTWQLILIGAGVAAASLAGCDEILALLAGSFMGVVLLRWTRPGSDPPEKTTLGALAGIAFAGTARTAQAASMTAAGTCAVLPAAIPLWKLGLFFLEVGVVFFGGGYVLVAYLEGGLVQGGGLMEGCGLTQRQLLDAVAIGQLTPGPMLSTVTFVGYLVGGGVAGAAVATVAILLPSFFFVAIVNPLVPRLRKSPWASRFLDAVNAAAIGLMAAVTITLSRATFVDPSGLIFVDWRSGLIAIATVAVMLRWKVAPAWLVLAGAVAGRLLCAI